MKAVVVYHVLQSRSCLPSVGCVSQGGFGLRGRTCPEQRMCSEVLVLGGARVSAGTEVWVAVIRRCPGPGHGVTRQCRSGNIWHQRGWDLSGCLEWEMAGGAVPEGTWGLHPVPGWLHQGLR